MTQLALTVKNNDKILAQKRVGFQTSTSKTANSKTKGTDSSPSITSGPSARKKVG